MVKLSCEARALLLDLDASQSCMVIASGSPSAYSLLLKFSVLAFRFLSKTERFPGPQPSHLSRQSASQYIRFPDIHVPCCSMLYAVTHVYCNQCRHSVMQLAGACTNSWRAEPSPRTSPSWVTKRLSSEIFPCPSHNTITATYLLEIGIEKLGENHMVDKDA